MRKRDMERGIEREGYEKRDRERESDRERVREGREGRDGGGK